MIESFERLGDLPIFKFTLSKNALDKITRDVHYSLDKKVDVSSTLVGAIYNGCEVLLETTDSVFTDLGYKFLENTSNNPTDKMKLHVSEAWTVLQKENDYNPLHVHSSFLSGILYIEVPNFIGNVKDTRTRTCKKNEDGFLVFLNGYNFITIRPVVGEGYVFASNVPHMVYPFTDEGRRISISWNLDVKLAEQIVYR